MDERCAVATTVQVSVVDRAFLAKRSAKIFVHILLAQKKRHERRSLTSVQSAIGNARKSVLGLVPISPVERTVLNRAIDSNATNSAPKNSPVAINVRGFVERSAHRCALTVAAPKDHNRRNHNYGM